MHKFTGGLKRRQGGIFFGLIFPCFLVFLTTFGRTTFGPDSSSNRFNGAALRLSCLVFWALDTPFANPVRGPVVLCGVSVWCVFKIFVDASKFGCLHSRWNPLRRTRPKFSLFFFSSLFAFFLPTSVSQKNTYEPCSPLVSTIPRHISF